MDKNITQKNKTINHSSTYTKKKYFQGLKLAKEKPIKAILFQKDKEKAEEPISIKTIMNKSNRKIVSIILQFLKYKDINQFKNINKHFQK